MRLLRTTDPPLVVATTAQVAAVSFPETKGREIVRLRSDGRCEVVVPNVCLGEAHTMHHRLKRSHGGDWNPANILHVCGDGTRGCHGWIEAHPKLANEHGLWLRAGEDPEETSVYMRWVSIKSWYVLDAEGLMIWDSCEFERLPDGASKPLSFTRR